MLDIRYVPKKVIGLENISLGEITFGSNTQSTYLASCLSLIVNSPSKKIGGISHIVGRKGNNNFDFNFAKDVIEEFNKKLLKYYIYDPEYYLVGGTNMGIHVTERAINEIDNAGIQIVNKNKVYGKYNDILGEKYKDILYDPTKQLLLIHAYSKNQKTDLEKIDQFYKRIENTLNSIKCNPQVRKN